MARIDKMRSQATEFIGHEVHRCALVSPPGSATYGSVSKGAAGSPAMFLAQTIRQAAESKADGNTGDGIAGSFPTEFGLLCVTDDEVVYLKTSKLSGKPVERLAGWPAAETSIVFIPKEKGMKNPAVGLTFPDGSRLVAYGEPKWGIDSFA